jgi:hypothetical protein
MYISKIVTKKYKKNSLAGIESGGDSHIDFCHSFELKKLAQVFWAKSLEILPDTRESKETTTNLSNLGQKFRNNASY